MNFDVTAALHSKAAVYILSLEPYFHFGKILIAFTADFNRAALYKKLIHGFP